jgi:hypothetical protein
MRSSFRVAPFLQRARNLARLIGDDRVHLNLFIEIFFDDLAQRGTGEVGVFTARSAVADGENSYTHEDSLANCKLQNAN